MQHIWSRHSEVTGEMWKKHKNPANRMHVHTGKMNSKHTEIRSVFLLIICTANIPPLAYFSICFTHIFITGSSTLQEAVVARLFVHPSVNMCVEEGASKRDGAGGGVANWLL